jgi:hypothetical protein
MNDIRRVLGDALGCLVDVPGKWVFYGCPWQPHGCPWYSRMCFAEERSDRHVSNVELCVSVTDLVIRDGLGHILDETVQQSGMILIPQESQQSVLFGKRFQFFEDIHQPPANISRKR